MIPDSDPAGILAEMAKHEEALGVLYRGYAERFPELRGFWTRLSEEEAFHAELLQAMRRKLAEGHLRPQPGRFNARAVRLSLEYVLQRISALELERVSVLRALSVTLDLESAIIERRFFETVAEDSPQIRHILDRIREDTAGHIARVQEQWLKYGGREQ